MPMVRKQIRFTGRVQGVGFRATARGIARRHPVSGWVRNEPDGSVLLEVQGDSAAAGAFLHDLRAALGAHISGESSADAPLREGEAGFEIAMTPPR